MDYWLGLQLQALLIGHTIFFGKTGFSAVDIAIFFQRNTERNLAITVMNPQESTLVIIYERWRRVRSVAGGATEAQANTTETAGTAECAGASCGLFPSHCCRCQLTQGESSGIFALAGWLSWLEHHPVHQKAAGSILGEATYGRQLIHVSRTLMFSVSPPSPSPSPFLSP